MTGTGPSCGWLWRKSFFNVHPKIFGEDVHLFWSFWLSHIFQLGGWAKVNDDVVYMLILKTNKKGNRPDLWEDPPDWKRIFPEQSM